ncbi:hypothetical protein [Nocardia barduliensis]|uniref:hypothetical protein n=1 Tax=Nocardia barduliensis TaxID=2736643 RepID=UPI001574BEBE|nr:hypothetical protein [Nocardia barduliensis]
MTPLLVAIPWTGSVVFAGALCFRLGYWWKSTELQGRHAAGNVAVADDPWADEETLGEPDWDQTSPSARPPARPVRWWSDEDDTEKLPQTELDDGNDEEF